MWIPHSWSDLELAIGALHEDEFLDFKKGLPPGEKIADIAKDAAAMSLQGGVVVIGVDEKDRLATQITPIALKGAVERIRQVIDARVTPPLPIEFTTLTKTEGDSEGVVVLSVSPSGSAPHQYEHRFPARSGPTTRWLTESELETLFARRAAIAAGGAATGGIQGHKMPRGVRPEPDETIGVMRMRMQPLVAVRHPEEPRLGRALTQALLDAGEPLPDFYGRFHPKAFDFLQGWKPSGPYGWQSGIFEASAAQIAGGGTVGAFYGYGEGFSFTTRISLTDDIEPDAPPGARMTQEHHWAVETMALLAYGARYFLSMPEASLLRVDLELGGLLDTVSHQASGGIVFDGDIPTVTENAYHASGLFAAVELAADPRQATRELLDPFMVSILEEGTDIVDAVATA